MWARLDRLFEPHTSDPELARRERALLVSISLLVAVSLIKLVITGAALSIGRPGMGPVVTGNTILLVLYAVLSFIAQRGWIDLASRLLVFGFTTEAVAATLGRAELSIGLLATAVLLAVLLIGPRSGLAIALIVPMLFFGIRAAGIEFAASVAPPVSTELVDIAVVALVMASQLLLMLGIAWFAIRQLLQSLGHQSSAAEHARQEAERLVREQQSTLEALAMRNADQERLLELVAELQVPIMAVTEGVIVLPLVGALDTRRADQIEMVLLREINQRRASVVIMDVTGVSIVDTAIARRLLEIANAVQLLGAHAMISGIRASLAQTVVTLGVDLRGLRTFGDLQDALESTLVRNALASRS